MGKLSELLPGPGSTRLQATALGYAAWDAKRARSKIGAVGKQNRVLGYIAVSPKP